MKKKLLYILTTGVISLTAFIIGRNTNNTIGNDNINLNTVVDYVPVNDGIILHIVDHNGKIDGYSLEIPCGIHEWKEKGYHGSEYEENQETAESETENNIEVMEKAIAQIEYWEIVNDGIDFYTYDGNMYKWR